MRKTLLTLHSLAFVLVLTACAQAFVSQDEITVRGRLARTVEAGGWIVNTDTEKYLLLNWQRFRNETWFRAGAEVEASGVTRKDAVTIFMEGIPFEVRALRPTAGGSQGNSQAVTSQAGRQLTRVVVSGDSLVRSQPDTATVMLAVITQNANASEAQAENASRSDAVMRAVKAAAGPGAEVRTGGYSLQPQYDYTQGQAPKITSYLARNSVIVTLGELQRVGAVIDAATRAGANNVDGLSFSLRQDKPARNRALTEATRDAMEKARVLAEALGGRLVRIVEVHEGGMARPVPIYAAYAGGGTAEARMSAPPPTPVEPGTLEVRAQVQLVAEIETKQ